MRGLFLCLTLFIIPSSFSFSQQTEKPIHLNSSDKIGLCLSGGGAKGLAHIGLLKLIDSLGIKIDYITGTSMGSVIGGLYASGYTGNQIDSISRTADWEIILNQYVPADQINMDEKDEYNKYIAEIPFSHGRFNFTGIIDGQALQNILNRLTHHVNHVRDFDKLPIPYRCMAVDILTMTPVVLDSGNLALAMRSSMSIPTVFKPIKWNNYLLVDGGLMVNFPVKQLQAMGANFIIGSYTGGRLFGEDEMNTINKLLIQSSSFYGINEAADDIAACNIFNNLTMNMLEYDAGDFKFANEIIEKGIEVSRKVLPKLKELSKQYHQYHGNFKRPILQESNEKIVIDSIIIEGIDNVKLQKFILKRIQLNPGDTTNLDELDAMMIDAYSNRYLSKVYYTVEQSNGEKSKVIIHAVPNEKISFKAALHYDTDLGAGIVLNFTARNWFMANSRLVASIDLAESPKYGINYRKYLKSSRFSWYTAFVSETIKQRFYSNSGNLQDIYKSNFNTFFTGISYNINFPSTISAGFLIESNTFKPVQEKTQTDFILINRIQSKNIGFMVAYQQNNFDQLYFPKKGMNIYVENRLALQNMDNIDAQLMYTDSTNTIQKLDVNEKVLYQPSYRLTLNFDHFVQINNRNSIFYMLHGGILFKHIFDYPFKNKSGYELNSIDNSFTDYFQLGGQEKNTRSSYINLWGYKIGEISGTTFTSLQVGYQYEVIHKVFLQPFVNIAYLANSPKEYGENISQLFDFKKKADYSDDFTNLLGYGMNIRVKTVLGPINFSMSKINRYDKIRFYLSIGFRF